MCIKSASQLNSVLIYCRRNVANYFGHVQICLNTIIRMDGIIKMYLFMSHPKKPNTLPRLNFEI